MLRDPKEEEKTRGDQERIAGIVMKRSQKAERWLSTFMKNIDEATFCTTVYHQLRKTGGLKTCIFQTKT